ncbi:MAG: prolyl oligopeptidase family serine peptidase [Deltaproteobacteria bacterium]|nr:prolyl oligopeptidase family serine peptidase [Deltaproteobacteria bacterium]
MRWATLAMAVLMASCATKGAKAPENDPTAVAAPKYDYPAARRSDVKDTYHGVEVADPYRWLEDPDSEESRAWIDAENAITFGFLEKVGARDAIRERARALWDYEKFGVPVEEGGRLFYEYNPGLLNQEQIFVKDSADAEARLLLDPNTLSADGTVAVSAWSVSRDGEHLAYALSSSGSDWKTWKVRKVDDGTDLPDEVKWSKFSGAAWAADGSGFYYGAYDAPKSEEEEKQGANFFQKLYFHTLGKPQSEDRLVYERKDHKEWGFDAQVTEDGTTLVIHVWKGTAPENQLFTLDLKDARAEVIERLSGFDALYHFIGKAGSTVFLRTTKDAPRARIMAFDLSASEVKLTEVVPQREEPLESVAHIGGRLVATYLSDAKHSLRLFEPAGLGAAKDLGELALPVPGTLTPPQGHADAPTGYFAFTSFTYPTTVFRLDVAKASLEIFRQPEVDFDPGAFETRQVFVKSKDGTKVPAFITHKKGLALDGARPTYLYGYGGFNVSLTPYYSTSNLVWMEMGGVYVSTNLRGGGEYGEAWHQAGILERKQNVFDDFHAIAEWLKANGYTRTDRLAIGGGSNGGLLVGASITQHPESFGAAIAAVGVMDMLRYHTWTIGWAWASDYGTSEDAKVFPALLAYSPLHNVKEGTHYPPTLITTADHDDRVVPAHSFKFAAALQHAQAGPAPVLIRIETKAGHGAGKPTEKILDEVADRWAFLHATLGGLEAPAPVE